jgi:CRP-like cAMP-binding protein
MVTSITSLDKEIPAVENIEAIEDCRLLAISNQHMKQLYDEFPSFNIVGRKLLQEYYRDAENRAYIVRLSNAGLKYQYFMEKYSQLANRISLKYIASFLGMTLETLSRVRSKMSKTT